MKILVVCEQRFKGIVLKVLLPLCILFFVLLSGHSKAQTQTYIFTTNGTIQLPAGVTSVTAKCWGGGGAGGRAITNILSAGGGGAGGAYAEKIVSGLTAGSSYTVTVGQAKASVTSNTASLNNGNDSWFQAVGVVIAKGGPGGGGVNTATNGIGGIGTTTGSIGTITRAGGSGVNGNRTSGAAGGAGGGGAGTLNAGGAGSAGTGGTGGTVNGGNGGAGPANNSVGNTGLTYGGGGSGGKKTSGTSNYTGGPGAAGRVEISYTGPPTYPFCVPTYSVGCNNAVDVITRVIIGTLDNSTTYGTTCATRYTYYNGVSAPVLAIGNTYNLQITVGSDADNWTAAWFDFNQDGDFNDAGEYFNGGNAGSNGTASISVTIPSGYTGITRMRIRGGEDSNINNQSYSCGASPSGYGEAEDYSVNIIAPCTAPSGGSVSGNNSVCSGATGVQYTYSGGSPAADAWAWVVPSGASISAGAGTATITVNWGTATSGNVTCTPSAGGCGGVAVSRAVTVNPVPANPVISGNATVCGGSTQTYTCTATGTSYTWAVPAGWSISSGQGSTSVNVVAAAGVSSGNVSVYATNTCGNSGTVNYAVSAPWSANAGTDIVTCTGSATLAGGTTGTIPSVTTTGSTVFNYSGSGTDCSNFVIGGATSGMPAGATITSVNLAYTIGPNCTSWYELWVYVNGGYLGWSCNGSTNYNGLNGAAANGQTFQILSWDNDAWCDDVTMTLAVTVNYTYTVAGTPTYSWSGPGSFSPNNTVSNPTVNALGTYTLSATAAGCTSTDQVAVTASGSAPVITQQPQNLNVCPSTASAVFNVTATGATGYQWQYDNAGTWTNLSNGSLGITGVTTNQLTLANPFANLGASTWSLRCIVIGSSCNTNTSAATFVVYGNVTASATPSATLACNNGSGTITLSPSAGSGNYTYSWTGPNGFTSISQNLSSLYAGTYNVTVTDQTCATTTTASAAITATWSANAGTDVAACTGSATLAGSVTGAIPPTITTLFAETFEGYGDIEPLPATGAVWRQSVITGSSWVWEIWQACTPPQGVRCLTMYDGVVDCDYTWDNNGKKIAWYGTLINATGYTNVKMNFKWNGYGETSGCSGPCDYGRVVWSSDGTNWNFVDATNYMGQTGWQTVTNLDLSALNGTQFYIGFQWENDGNTGTAPGFSIDDISITGEIPPPTYSWSGPGSFTPNNTVLNPTVNAAGTYTLSVTASGCTSTDAVVVTMSPNVGTPSFTAGATSLCAGGTSTYTATVTNGTVSYSIQSGGASINPSTGVVSSVTSSFVVLATATGACGPNTTATLSVTVDPTVAITSVTAAATGPLCSTSTTTVTANGVVGSLNWYTGTGGTGTNLGTANPITVGPGTYYARVTGTCGGPAEASVTVTLDGNVATPTFTAGATTLCQDAANTTYTATASNTTGITYSVSPVGAGTINSSSGVMDWSSSFSGTATITASAAGCNGPQTNNQVVTVNPNLPASVSIGASASTICPGTSVTFTATPTNGGGSPSYQWKVNGSNVATGNPFTTTSLVHNDVVTVVMTSNATCPTGSPATSNAITITVISPASPTISITAQPTCAAPGGTIDIVSPLGSAYEYALNGGTYQSSPTFTGLAAGNYSATVRLAASPLCVSSPSSSQTINSNPSPLPAAPTVFVCQGGSGALVSSNNCINNFVIPFITNSIYYGWAASGDPTAATPSGTVNTTTCVFGGPVRTYSKVDFQVSVTGNYIFEMNDNAAYNGVGYIYTGNFTPGSCGSGTLVRADRDDGVAGDEPRMGGAGGSGAMALTAGITYTLVSSTEGVSDITAYDYTWTITPPPGGNIMLNEPGTVQWYTAASGGSPIYTGQSFNPVGVSGSGLANTNTAGTWTYYAACSSSPGCRTASAFTITNTTTLFNITPVGSSTCYNASSPISVGISGSLNGMTYELVRDGVQTGTTVVGNGAARTVGNTSVAGIYTVVAVIGPGCLIPMTGSVEVKPAPIANAGSDITLCGSSIALTGSSNATTLATENFGAANTQLTNTSSGWRIHYLYNNHPANRTEWWTTYSGASPYSATCATAGSALVTVDNRQFQSDVPCDYAWDAGIMDEIAYKITPIDARLYTSVNVSFNYIAGGNYTGGVVRDYMQVMYSLDNGASWVAVSAGNNGGSYTLLRQLNGATNAFFSTTGTTVTGVANVSLPLAVTGQYFLLGFRWTNDGSLTGDYVGNTMVDNIVVTGAASYSWSPTTGVTGPTTSTPSITVPGTYTVTVTAGNGCTATDDVIVLPRPDITPTTLTTSACSGVGFSVTPVNVTNGSVPSGTTYSWSAPSVVGITGAAAGTNAASISGTLTNITTSPINVTYSVAPTGNGCTGPSFNVQVTVNRTPAVTAMSATACSGSAFTVTPVNTTNGIVPGGTTYSWLAPSVTGGLGGGASGSGASLISGTLTNPTTSQQTATYSVTPSIGTCTGLPFDVTVAINPPVTLPTVITYTGTEPTCQLTSISTTDYNSTATVGTLEWSLTGIVNTSGILLASAINSSTGVLTWPSGWYGSVTINVRTTGCGTSAYVTRTVNVGIGVLNAGYRTWTGLALNQLWNDNGNWDCGGVPTLTDEVWIPETPLAGVNQTPIIHSGILGHCLKIFIEGNISNRIEIRNGGELRVHF